MHAGFVEQRQVKIRQRSGLFVTHVAASLQAGCTATCHQNWQVGVVMNIGVAYPASIKQQGLIQ